MTIKEAKDYSLQLWLTKVIRLLLTYLFSVVNYISNQLKVKSAFVYGSGSHFVISSCFTFILYKLKY